MKVELFKKLIKEAVSEAVREELNNIINNNPTPIQENKSLNFTSNDVMAVRTNIKEKMGNMFGLETPSSPNNGLKVDNNSGNPYMSFITDAVVNMTPQERSGLSNLG
jgi:hypothetical protein